MASPTGTEIPLNWSGAALIGMDTGVASPQTWSSQLPLFGAGVGGEKVRLLRKADLLRGLKSMKDPYRFDAQSKDWVLNLFFVRKS